MTRDVFYKALTEAKNEQEKILVAMDYNAEAEKIFREHLPASFKEETKQKYCAMLELLLYDYCIKRFPNQCTIDSSPKPV